MINKLVPIFLVVPLLIAEEEFVICQTTDGEIIQVRGTVTKTDQGTIVTKRDGTTIILNNLDCWDSNGKISDGVSTDHS